MALPIWMTCLPTDPAARIVTWAVPRVQLAMSSPT